MTSRQVLDVIAAAFQLDLTVRVMIIHLKITALIRSGLQRSVTPTSGIQVTSHKRKSRASAHDTSDVMTPDDSLPAAKRRS